MNVQAALDEFVDPFLGQPVWGAKQGYGSFLTLEFGKPELVVRESVSKERGKRRHAYVQGQWHIWVYCTEWGFFMQGDKIAWSESSRDDIARATSMLNGQLLTGISLDPRTGRSTFQFDLGGRLETWPTGDDPTDEQWLIYRRDLVFSYRADGRYSKQTGDTPRVEQRWFPEFGDDGIGSSI